LNGYVDFPHAAQVFCLQRQVCELATGALRRETVYGITSLLPAQASPAQLLALVRAHWTIENRLHWVRDVTFDEDRSQIRRGAGPQVMATLRNLAISLLRLAGAPYQPDWIHPISVARVIDRGQLVFIIRDATAAESPVAFDWDSLPDFAAGLAKLRNLLCQEA